MKFHDAIFAAILSDFVICRSRFFFNLETTTEFEEGVQWASAFGR